MGGRGVAWQKRFERRVSGGSESTAQHPHAYGAPQRQGRLVTPTGDWLTIANRRTAPWTASASSSAKPAGASPRLLR